MISFIESVSKLVSSFEVIEKIVCFMFQTLMDQMEEEQDNNFKISAQKRALEAEVSEIKANTEMLTSSLKSVRVFKMFILFENCYSTLV